MSNQLWSILLLLACLWAGSFPVYEVGLESLSFSTLVMYRICGAALFLWLFALWRGWQIPKGRIWLQFIILGFLHNALPFSLIAWGQQYIEGGLSAILNSTTAIFGTFLAPFFFIDERLTTRKLVGILVGFAGVVIAIGLHELQELNPRNLGQLAVISASLSYALGGIYAKKTIKAAPQIQALGMLSMASIMMIIFHFASEPNATLMPTRAGFFAALYLAIVSTALAYLLFYKILAEAGVSYIVLVTLLIPPIAIGLGAIFLDEAIGAGALMGFLLVALALIIIDGRALAWLKRNMNLQNS